MNSPTNTNRTFYNYFELVLKGFCMGIADVIPGVSGGTIAFIFGIYEELIQSIKSFNMIFLKLLFRFRIKEAFGQAQWQFLGCIVLGIVLAILSLAKIISWLLHHKPVFIHSFFFGLILATIPIIARIIKKWTVTEVCAIFIGAVGTCLIVTKTPLQTPEHYLFIFISGAIAISAMIMPGISGAFILLLLGKYEFMLEAVNQRDFFIIGIFIFGIGVGIVTFVRVLNWLFKRYHDITMSFLTGVVLGSLVKIWPWKETVEVLAVSEHKIIPIREMNVMPPHFDGQVIAALCLMAVGFLAALMLNSSPSQNT